MMEVDPEQAQESLRAIEKARVAATRHSQNNGVVLLVWGAVVLVGLILFDILQPQFAAITLAVLAGGTSIWQIYYAKRLPVQPLTMESSRVIIGWAFYYVIVLFGGTFGGLWLFHGKPPFLFTVIGIFSSAPLLFFGWRMWHRSHVVER